MGHVVFNRSCSHVDRRRSSQPWCARHWSELRKAGGGAKWLNRWRSREGAVRAAVVVRAVLALFVAGSGPGMDGWRSCCVKDPSPVGGVARNGEGQR